MPYQLLKRVLDRIDYVNKATSRRLSGSPSRLRVRAGKAEKWGPSS